MIHTKNPDGRAPKAMLVEDDELIRDLVAQYLEQLGFEVLEAPDGRDAIELLQRLTNDRLDLIVTDLLMPIVGGEAVVREAQDRNACDRFLIISGFTQYMPKLESRVRQRSIYLEKPFNFSDFEHKVEELYQTA